MKESTSIGSNDELDRPKESAISFSINRILNMKPRHSNETYQLALHQRERSTNSAVADTENENGWDNAEARQADCAGVKLLSMLEHHTEPYTKRCDYGNPSRHISRQVLFKRRIGHSYQSRALPYRKQPRKTFESRQVDELELLFHTKRYLTSYERQSVAKQLQMSDSQVKTWFQNRRTKWKRQCEEEVEERQINVFNAANVGKTQCM